MGEMFFCFTTDDVISLDIRSQGMRNAPQCLRGLAESSRADTLNFPGSIPCEGFGL